jgi:hypothetical protein
MAQVNAPDSSGGSASLAVVPCACVRRPMAMMSSNQNSADSKLKGPGKAGAFLANY